MWLLSVTLKGCPGKWITKEKFMFIEGRFWDGAWPEFWEHRIVFFVPLSVMVLELVWNELWVY